MGYYTTYEVSVHIGNEYFEDLENEIATTSAAEYGNPFDESCKWYEHEKHMKDFSKKHPETVFVLHGEGEESGDIWYKYFHNGKMQEARAKITYDDYDPKKLK